MKAAAEGRGGAWVITTVVVVLLGLLTHGTYAGSGDEPHYLAIAHSLAFDGDLDMSNNYGAGEPLIGGGGLQPEAHVRAGRGGVPRPVHDIGLPLLFVPYVRVAEPAVTALANHLPQSVLRRLRMTPSTMYRNAIAMGAIALAAVLAWVFRGMCLRLDLSSGQAAVATLAIALSPPLLIFGILFFTELLSALLAIFALSLTGSAASGRRPAAWLAVGLLIGALLLVHVRNVGLSAALTAVALFDAWRTGRVRAAAAVLGGVAVFVVLRVAITYDFWGSFLTTPLAQPGAWGGISREVSVGAKRLAALLIDREFGLLPYAPIYLLTPVGAYFLWQTRPGLFARVCVIGAGALIPIVLPLVNVQGWSGGWSPPARFLVPLVPLFGLCVAAAIARAPRFVVVPLLVLQCALDAYLWQHQKVLWNDGDGTAAICTTVPAFCSAWPSFTRVQ